MSFRHARTASRHQQLAGSNRDNVRCAREGHERDFTLHYDEAVRGVIRLPTTPHGKRADRSSRERAALTEAARQLETVVRLLRKDRRWHLFVPLFDNARSSRKLQYRRLLPYGQAREEHNFAIGKL